MYDNVFPLRMEPPNGEFGSQDFNDFVDSLLEPMFNKTPCVIAGDVDTDVTVLLSGAQLMVTVLLRSLRRGELSMVLCSIL